MKKFALLVFLILAVSAQAVGSIPYADTVLFRVAFFDSVTACSVYVKPFNSPTATAFECTLLTASHYRNNNSWWWGTKAFSTTTFAAGKQYILTYRGKTATDTFVTDEILLIDSLTYRLKQGWDSSLSYTQLSDSMWGRDTTGR